MVIDDDGPHWLADDPSVCEPTVTPTSYYSITPCRAFDSRETTSLLASGLPTPVNVRTRCAAIPASAVAVSANVTVVGPTAAGRLHVLPGGCFATPTTQTVAFGAGQTRASQAMLTLAKDGSGTVSVTPNLPTGGSIHVVLDVSGYFSPKP